MLTPFLPGEHVFLPASEVANTGQLYCQTHSENACCQLTVHSHRWRCSCEAEPCCARAGDSLLFAGGAFCASGALQLATVCTIFLSAAILGDAVNYYAGSRLGVLSPVAACGSLPVQRCQALAWEIALM